MPRFKAVFLDVGDTLLTMGEPLAVYRDILIEHGHQVELAAVERALQAARQVSRSAVADSDQGTLRERAEARRERMVHQLLTQLGVKTRFLKSCSRPNAAWSSAALRLDCRPVFPEAG